MGGCTRLLLALLLAPAAVLAEIDCSTSDSEYRTTNPLGTCACDGQLWVGAGCLEGFWCEDTSGSGCYKTCSAGEFLATDFENDNWECLEDGGTTPIDRTFDFFDESRTTTSCPVETGYHVCPGSGNIPTPIPPEEVTGNPFGTCRCDGEIWLAEGCAYGFYCDEAEDIGGIYLSCAEGENLHVDFDTKTWTCDTTPGNCPGGEILGAGCPVPICQYSINPYGECSCENQFFISNDCTQGFLCYSNLPDPYLYDGCLKRCLNGQIVVPNFETKQMTCMDAPADFVCPGSVQLHCPDDDVGNDFNGADCECNGQLRVSQDCTESFYCLDRLPNGGANLTCPEGQIVDFNFLDYSWTCTDNLGNCPSEMGGFELGCSEDGENPIPPPQECQFAPNSIVEDGCGCNGQMFVNDDCTQSFYCSNYIPANETGADGCELNCPAENGLRVHIDLETKEWECRERESNFICPGKLQTDCAANFNVFCECKNQLWINEDCSQGYWCSNEYDQENNDNPGSFIKCPPGTIISLSFIYPPRYQCVTDVGQCPGSFHFGCEGGDLIDLTTTTTTTTTTKPDPTDPSETTEAPKTTDASQTTAPPVTTDASQTTTTTTAGAGPVVSFSLALAVFLSFIAVLCQ